MNTEVEILEFLKTKENTGALLLTGQWGCGKSYLVKKLAEKLNTKTSNYHMSIISLFGIDTIATLNRCVKEAYLAASSGIFTKTVKKAAQGVGTLLKSGVEVASAVDPTSAVSAGIAKGIGNAMTLNVFDYIPVKNEFGRANNRKKFILVFDDLERCKINIVDLLGAINEYSENKKIKTIIIADEEKILKREDDKKDYGDFKEKIIFQTIKLESDYDEIIESIISQYQETEKGYLKFIKANTHILKQVFYESKYNNIRTVKALLSSFERVYREWIKTKISTARLEDVLYSYSAIYFAHKANEYPKTKYGYDETKIKEKHNRFDRFYLFSSTCKWITEGYWDAERFNWELTQKFCAVKVSDEQRFLQHNFWDLDESIIQTAIPLVLQKAYNGELCFDEIISLLQRLKLLETYNVPLPVEVDFTAIESGLNARLTQIQDGLIEEPKKGTFLLPEEVKLLHPTAQNIYNTIELEDDRRSAWETRLAVIQKLKNFEGVNIYVYKSRSIVSFDDEFFNAFYDAYVKADNGDKHDLYLLLKEIDFTNTIISKVSDLELTIKNLEELLQKIKDLYETITDAFAKAIVNSTIVHLPEIIKEIKTKKVELESK